MSDDRWPDPPRVALETGLLGEIVSSIAPHTEADPVAVLADLLASFGNAIGSGPHLLAGNAEHPARLFVVLVGDSAKARKGTSRAVVRSVMAGADQEWAERRNKSGLSSGEGLVTALEGDDERLFVFEGEFARVLHVMRREGNTLSPILRDAWDTGNFSVLTKQAATATGHLSVVGHITREELRIALNSTDAHNGFANRFLWVLVHRSQLLPDGGNVPEDERRRLSDHLGCAVRKARKIGLVTRTEAAREAWRVLYERLGDDCPGGLLGGVTSRDASQVQRLSLAYALADGCNRIDVPHQDAAADLWQYCRTSAEVIFGNRSGDRDYDRLVEALLRAAEDGLTRTDIVNLYGRHLAASRIDDLCARLIEDGQAEETKEASTGGRPARILRALPGAKEAK